MARRGLVPILGAALGISASFLILLSGPAASATRHRTSVAASPAPSPVPVVVSLHEITASRAVAIIRGFYPNLRVRVDQHSNAVIAVAPPDEADAIRTILQGIDVRDPASATTDAETLHNVSPARVVAQLRGVFPTARFFVAPNHTLISVASSDDLEQIKSVIAAIDTPLQTPTPRPRYPVTAVRITQRSVHQVALAVAHSAPDVVVSISGSEILLRGPPDDVQHAQDLIAQLDVPQMGVTYPEVYRLRYVDAGSVANLLGRSFPSAQLAVDTTLNALTVTANATLQTRIAQAVSALDAAPPGAPGSGVNGGGGVSMDVVTLKAALPASSGGPSTSANDLAQTVQDVLRENAPDLHITVPQNGTQLILTGTPYSIHLAEALIAKLDVMPPLVVLDTEILEVDEGVSKQLGFAFPSAALSTTYSEITPPTQSNGQPGIILGLQGLTRTPLSLEAELNFLVSTNKARILEDPRITTVSGRTATIRAGETVNILTTTGGGTGTVATTQVQSFQTGVSLDITPVVNAGGFITIELHPSVNSEAGVSAAGVPNIQTRDTQTTVGLRDGQTLVIGGLIEDDQTRTVQKIPFLGDLPLIGKLFQDTNVSNTRNELIITITPHIVAEQNAAPGETVEGSSVPGLSPPSPAPLPTLGPAATLPPPEPRVAVATSTPHAAVTSPPAAVPSVTSGAHPDEREAPTPVPLPSAFAQTNVYTYGSPPTNNFASNTAAAQIFYVQVQPTVISQGQTMTISAITTTNVVKLTFGTSPAAPETELTQLSPGKWQSTFTFGTAGLPIGQSNVQLMLTASTGMGGTVSVPIPVSVLQP